MQILGEHRAWGEQEWQALWSRRAPDIRIAKELLSGDHDVDSLVRDACNFLGGMAYGSKFRLFHNGGVPLLERRRGPWTEEIIFRSPTSGRAGVWAPLTMHIHLSCDDFFEVRQRYWSVLTKPPRVVATGNVGQTESPPCWILWNLAAGSPVEPVSETMADHLMRHAIPWFEGFANPARMRRKLFDEGIPLLDPITALEWCLYEFGTGEANAYLHEVLAHDELLRDSVVRLFERIDPNYLEGGPNLPLARNVAAMAATFGLAIK